MFSEMCSPGESTQVIMQIILPALSNESQQGSLGIGAWESVATALYIIAEARNENYPSVGSTTATAATLKKKARKNVSVEDMPRKRQRKLRKAINSADPAPDCNDGGFSRLLCRPQLSSQKCPPCADRHAYTLFIDLSRSDKRSSWVARLAYGRITWCALCTFSIFPRGRPLYAEL